VDPAEEGLMSDFWRLKDEDQTDAGMTMSAPQQTGGAVRKEQITIRLDPGMIADAREIATRKGIGHHTLLRMWVQEGINRAYEDGLLARPPRNWSTRAERAAAVGEELVQDVRPAPPSGARWARLGRGRNQ
jgi:hypothetical protein